MPRALAATVATLVLGLVLATCGDDGGAATAACPSGAVTIAMEGTDFVPDEATAKVGQKICWANESALAHNVVAESGADFKSDVFGNGETFTAEVDKRGRVEYVCEPHRGEGMLGAIEARP